MKTTVDCNQDGTAEAIDGAALELETLLPNKQAVSLDEAEAMAGLITDYCEAESSTTPTRAAVRVANFAVDQFIRHHEEMLKKYDARRSACSSQHIVRRIDLARTIRRKLSRLYFES